MKLQNVFFTKNNKTSLSTTLNNNKPDLKKEEDVDKCIHIRVRQRNNRKRITTLYGLPDAYDDKKLKEMLKYLKNKLCCGGFIGENEKYGKFVELTGDKNKDLQQYLLDKNIIDDLEKIKIHGSAN